jgi:hypothetical protein
MSYVITIVAPRIAEDDATAWQELDALLETDDAPAAAVFRVLHDQLTARYPCLCSLSDDEIDDGVWSDGPLINNFGCQVANLGISYSRVDEVLPFLIETANALDLAVLDAQSGYIHRAEGFRSCRLTLQDQPIFYAPTLIQLQHAVKALTPDGGPGFLILESRSGNYMQAAGGDDVYTAEWREYQGERFQHWVAGHPNRPSTHEIAIPTNGFQVTVNENEQLTAADVKCILEAFARDMPRPSKFSWRDVTARFS